MIIKKIISGGQTGVDRAALDMAILLQIPYGGWCPLGRLAELGQHIPEKYLLQEAPSSDFNVRTKLNIEDADATLIIVPRLPVDVTDGTLFTIDTAKALNKPYLIVSVTLENAEKIYDWITQHQIHILNIAGPRESQSPGIYYDSCKLIEKLLRFL